MPLFKGASDWLEYRKAQGVNRGDPIDHASQPAAAKTEGGGGFYTSEPSSRR